MPTQKGPSGYRTSATAFHRVFYAVLLFRIPSVSFIYYLPNSSTLAAELQRVCQAVCITSPADLLLATTQQSSSAGLLPSAEEIRTTFG